MGILISGCVCSIIIAEKELGIAQSGKPIITDEQIAELLGVNAEITV